MRFTKHFFVGLGALALGGLNLVQAQAQPGVSKGLMRVLGGVENIRNGWVRVEFGPEGDAPGYLSEFIRFQHEITCSMDAENAVTCGFYLNHNGDARSALPDGEFVDQSIVLSTHSFTLKELPEGLLSVTFQDGLIRNSFSGKDISCTVETCGFTVSPYGTIEPLQSF